ncbi:MAG: hypothetical protein ACRCTQ_05165 [Brevinemataceae bacterium]
MKSHTNIFSWIDRNMNQAMENIDKDIECQKNLKLLDSLISMRKKYDGSIDILGERIRVMEHFIEFAKLHFFDDLETVKKICEAFLEDSFKA